MTNSTTNSNVTPAGVRPLSLIARDIHNDWKNVYFGAVPWLHAMRSMTSIGDNYGADSAETIVIYFLSNATTWRGETARRIKLELKDLLKSKKL